MQHQENLMAGNYKRDRNRSIMDDLSIDIGKIYNKRINRAGELTIEQKEDYLREKLFKPEGDNEFVRYGQIAATKKIGDHTGSPNIYPKESSMKNKAS